MLYLLRRHTAAIIRHTDLQHVLPYVLSHLNFNERSAGGNRILCNVHDVERELPHPLCRVFCQNLVNILRNQTAVYILIDCHNRGKAAGADTKFFVINGNHDVDDSNGLDFSSGAAVQASLPTPPRPCLR